MKERPIPANDRAPEAEIFGDDAGRPILRLAIRSEAGAEAKILTWGAVIQDLIVPLADGRPQRVVLGFPDFRSYRWHSPYFGAVVGRYANRIAQARFALDGQTYELDRNERSSQILHGGAGGLSQRIWTVLDHDARSITLERVSPHGDQGFPGTLTARCSYSFVGAATLRMQLTAVCDATTVVSLAQHSYFNLDGSASILDHRLQLAATHYTPVDGNLIPTGEILSVAGSRFDFRSLRRIGQREAAGEAFAYDHNFVLSNGVETDIPRHAATLVAPASDFRLQISTTAPGLQFYDGHQLAVPVKGLDGRHYGANAGLCLEAQNFPDSPNQPAFPSARLAPGEVYSQTTDYCFSTGDADHDRQ